MPGGSSLVEATPSRSRVAWSWLLALVALATPLGLVVHQVVRIHRGRLPPFATPGALTGAKPAPPETDTGTGTLHVAGSGSNLPLTRILARAYGRRRPGTAVVVHESIGSSGGVRAVLEGAVGLGLVSRPLSATERDTGIRVIPYARVAVVAAANPSVPNEEITAADLVDVYRGTKSTWSDGSRAVVIQREYGDSSHLAVERHLPGFAEANADAYRARRWRVVYSDADMQAALQATEGAVGLFDLGSIVSQRLPLKILAIDGQRPAVESLAAGTYLFHKDLAFVCRPPACRNAASFFDFVLSEEGRALIRANGYLPLDGRPP